ncbi:MAG: methyltransferase domain-containing protein, partial [Verrucomicrobiota bacterium]
MNEERTNVEWEGKGLDYERYAMNILFRRMVERHGIKSVLEIPAKGEKAMPSLYSIPFGQHGCEVSLVNPEEKSKWAWEKLGYPVTYHEFDPVEKTDFDDGSFDLVWNFMSLSQYDRKDALVEEMKRVSRKYILFIAVNRFN